MVRVRQNGANDQFRVAKTAQDLCPAKRVVAQVGPALVIEIMEQRGNAPRRLVFAELTRIAANGRLNRQRVFAQAVALGVLRQQGPRRFARNGHATCTAFAACRPLTSAAITKSPLTFSVV